MLRRYVLLGLCIASLGATAIAFITRDGLVAVIAAGFVVTLLGAVLAR